MLSIFNQFKNKNSSVSNNIWIQLNSKVITLYSTERDNVVRWKYYNFKGKVIIIQNRFKNGRWLVKPPTVQASERVIWIEQTCYRPICLEFSIDLPVRYWRHDEAKTARAKIIGRVHYWQIFRLTEIMKH